MRVLKKLFAWILIIGLLLSSIGYGNVSVMAAGDGVNTSKYTISKKPGTYNDSVSITVKAKKGYKVYYTTGAKLSVKNVIKSGKSKKLKFKKTTTLKIYAVKKTMVITKKKLAQKKVSQKTVSYNYKITKGDDTSTDGADTTKKDDSDNTPNVESDTTKKDDSGNNQKDDKAATQKVETDTTNKNDSDNSHKDNASTTPAVTPEKDSDPSGDTEKPGNEVGGDVKPDGGESEREKPGSGENESEKPGSGENTPENPSDGNDDGNKVDFGSKTGGTPLLHMDIEEKSFEVPRDEETTLSVENSENESVKLILPEGTFAEDTNVSVEVVDGKIDIRQEGKEFTRLNEFVTVQIPLSEKPKNTELDYYKAAYYFGDTVYFIDPNREQLKNGILEFQTAHFSWFGATKLSEEEMKERMARNKALDEVTLEYKQKAIQSAIDELAGASLAKLGIEEGSKAYTAISRSLGQSTEFYNLIKSARENDYDAALQKLTEITITTLAENPDYLSATKVNITASVVGNTGSLIKAYKSGEYVEGFNAVMKTYADTIPAVKWGKVSIAVWQTGVDWIKDYETDAAYQVFLGEIRDGEHGVVLSNDGSGTDGWNRVIMQMQTTINQKVIEMKRSGPKSYMDYTEDETNEYRALVTQQLQNMFVNRYNKEKEIEEQTKEKKNILNALDRENLLSLLFYGKYVNDDYEVLCERMLKIYDSIYEMLGEENRRLIGDYERSELAYMTRLFVEESWDNGGKGLAGRAAVCKYMKEKYNVDIDEASVILSTEDITMYEVGDTVELELVGAGSSSTSWGTSNSSVAKIVKTDNHNVVKVKSTGTGLCKVYAVHNGIRHECWVTVIGYTLMPPITLSVYCTEQLSIPIEDGQGSGAIKWTTTGSDVTIDENPTVYSSYLAYLTAGGDAGTANVYALVGDKKLYKWVVTIEDIYLSITLPGLEEDVIIDQESSGMVIPVDFDKMYEENGAVHGFFSFDYIGPETSLYDESEQQLKRNEILEGAGWNVNKNYFKIDHDRGLGGFRGDLLYTGLIPVTFEIPSVGFSLTFSVNVIATPRIEIVGEKGTGVDFEIVVALIHVPKYDVVCNDNYDKTKYGAEYIPTPTNVEWNITSGSDCFYLVPDTSSTSYYATYKVKSIPDGYIDWVNNQTGDLILGISAGWMDYTVYAEKVYRHLSDY